MIINKLKKIAFKLANENAKKKCFQWENSAKLFTEKRKMSSVFLLFKNKTVHIKYFSEWFFQNFHFPLELIICKSSVRYLCGCTGVDVKRNSFPFVYFFYFWALKHQFQYYLHGSIEPTVLFSIRYNADNHYNQELNFHYYLENEKRRKKTHFYNPFPIRFNRYQISYFR